MSCIDVNNLAMKYYVERLLDEKANEAPMEYLRQRGFMRPIVKKLGLGFADGRLSNFIRGKGFTTQRVFESNLVKKNEETGQIRDFFYNRIVFPIDILGNTVYMSGRDLSGKHPSKYMNLPGSNSYFINEMELSTAGKYVFICEGWFDVASMTLGGFPAVGIAGVKRLSRDFIKKLYLKNQIFIMFDSEENQSGLNGSHKMAYEIAKIFPDKKVVVCSIPLPDGQKKIDINQILIECKGNTEKFQKIISNIKNFSRKDFKETDLFQQMRQEEIETVRVMEKKIIDGKTAMEIYSRILDLKPLSGNKTIFRSICPLHKDANPSFTIYSDYSFYCFSCGCSGYADDLEELIKKRSKLYEKDK